MTNTIIPAGFIIANDAAVWGIGTTEDAAWTDLRNGMKLARIPHDSEVDMEDTYRPRSWSEDQFTVLPATAALIARIAERGGMIDYATVGGIGCTTDEENALDA
jgi:hypothetical protein